MSQYRFPSLFINQFYPRPGTPAARMQRVPTQEVKQRSRALSQLFQSYQPYDHKVGERQVVLATELSHDQQHYVAHNKFYDQVRRFTEKEDVSIILMLQVLVPKDPSLLGKMFAVDIVTTGKHFLKGTVVRDSLEKMVPRPPPLPVGAVSGARTSHNVKQSPINGLGRVDITLLVLAVTLVSIALLLRFNWTF